MRYSDLRLSILSLKKVGKYSSNLWIMSLEKANKFIDTNWPGSQVNGLKFSSNGVAWMMSLSSLQTLDSIIFVKKWSLL